MESLACIIFTAENRRNLVIMRIEEYRTESLDEVDILL